MPGRILIVEDDEQITRSLERLLARSGYFVASEKSAEDAVVRLQADPQFDLALLDVMLPGQDGFACCRRLREGGWRNPIIFLTGRANAMFKVTGLDSGADDYLIKPIDPAELLARIRAHLRRVQDYNRPDTGNLIIVGPDLIIDTYAREARRTGRKVSLTEREFELLMLLARNPGKALERTWLFQQLWGCAPTQDMNALAVYVRRVREKIEENADRPHYLQTVRGYGYKLIQDEPQK